jgi:hypothetical protein
MFFFSLSQMRLTFSLWNVENVRIKSRWRKQKKERGKISILVLCCVYIFFATRCDKKFNEGRRALFWDFWLFFSHPLTSTSHVGAKKMKKKKYNIIFWRTKRNGILKGKERENEERHQQPKGEWVRETSGKNAQNLPSFLWNFFFFFFFCI